LIREQVPDVTLTVIGKNPPADFSSAAARSGGSIRVTGYIPDLTPYMEQAALMVIPVRAGGGMRVRILEAFARGIPVVTTTLGLEGIDAKPEQDVIVADTANTFSSAVIRLIGDQALQSQLARNGRRLAEAVYDRRIALQKLDLIYGQIKKGDLVGVHGLN
jgi:glycosyltransferase involved in cell wall biosynthesis